MTDNEKVANGICISDGGVDHCGKCVDVCEASHFRNQISEMVNPIPKPCSICGVPVDIHGTCCGWGNASTKINIHGIIIDERHPRFGQHYTSKN